MSERPVRNLPVQTALEAWAAGKDARTFSNVLRQCVAGELLLDISASTFADPEAGFQQGDTLALGKQVDAAGKELLVAFTSNERLSAYRRGERFLSLAQPAWSVLAEAMSRADGLALDPGDDALLIAYSEELRGQVTEEPGRNAALKNALVDRDLPWPQFLALLTQSSVVYVGVDAAQGAVPSAVGADGALLHPVFTSPAEVFAWSPELTARGTTVAQVARVAREDGYAGLLVDPAGPSATIRLDEVER
ncbi:SseB family protein [Leifsonia sp. NPDC080035]|uniref:SseB family protein n=1 Tax=Leifsonia sp. NPDC080035 TaxID=3143936 RepID=A0AAU7GE22_9MICO